MASAAGEGTSYGGTGGAGGKFRKRPFRKPQATPYDRPQTAIRNPSARGWLSKLVDPASKLISASAHLFFNSVLRKRLPPPPSTPQPEAIGKAEEISQHAVLDASLENGHGDQGKLADGGGNPTGSSGLSELEKILKQKTFTRSEIDSLTELLHSRTIDLPNGDKQKGSMLSQQQLIPASGLHDQAVRSPVQEIGMERRLEESHRLQGSISTPLLKSQVLEDDVAAPAELAKAYMGSRPSKVSPSVLGMRSRALREDASILSNSAFPQSPPVLSLARKPAVNFGISENGFMTPRSRGRSAIYNMARTPYSRGQPSSSQKGSGSVYDTYSGTPAMFSSQLTSDRDGHYSSTQSTLKRRSSVLEDDIGSVGPIRRLRQKTNLALPRNPTVPVRGTPFRYVNGVGTDGSQSATASAQKLLALEERKHKFSRAGGEYEDNSMPSTSYSQVPSKSSETASRILQQLEKIVPKEKSSEGKSLSVRDKSPSKLTSSMLHGQALKSIEAVDSSIFSYNATDKRKSLDLQKTSSPNTQKHDKVKESVPSRSIGSSDALASAGIGKSSILVQEAAPVAKTSPSHNPEFVKSSQKKQGFRMTAVEDLEELDDENNNDAAACTPLEEGKGKLKPGSVESKAAASSVNPSMDKSSAPEFRLSAGTVSNKSTGERMSDGIVAGQEKFAFSLSAPSSSAVTQHAASTQTKSAFEKEPTEVPFSSANDGKVGSPIFSLSSTPSESLVPEQTRPVSALKSFTDHKSGETGIVSKPAFDKVETKETQKSGSAVGKPEVSSSTAPASAPMSSIFSFGGPANNSNLSNGSSDLRLPASTSVPPVQFSEVSKQIFTKSPSNEASTASATDSISAPSTSASNSSPTTPPAASSFPSFNFGDTSGAPVNSVSTETAGPALAKVKLEKESSGNQSSLPSNGTASSFGSKGSNPFGFNASINSSSSAGNSSPFGSGSGALGSTEAALAGTGSVTAPQTAPFKLSSSSSFPAFGTSGVGSVSSGSTPFGSSTSGSLGLSSSSSGSTQFGSLGSGSSGIGFGSSSGASTSSAFGLSAASGSSMFVASSTSGSSGFGSSTTTIGSFGFGSSAAAGSSGFGTSTTGSSSTPGFMFNTSSTSGSSSMFGSSSTTGSSSTPAGFMFNTSTSGSGPIFGSPFSFGSSPVSSAAANNAPLIFGSSTTAASSVFPFTSASTSAPSSQAQPAFPTYGSSGQNAFGSSFPSPFTTAASAGGNNGGGGGDQMSMEDSMAEDTTAPKAPAFGQNPFAAAAPTPGGGFMFNSGVTSTGPSPSFQFGGQQQPNNMGQNMSPFQGSGSLGGSSFSLGSVGPGDKANRRIVKVKHNARRKK